MKKLLIASLAIAAASMPLVGHAQSASEEAAATAAGFDSAFVMTQATAWGLTFTAALAALVVKQVNDKENKQTTTPASR